MDSAISTFLEILKYSIPALIVFATVYFILKKYLNQQYNLEVLRFKQQESKNTLPLKLQAYERIALFCERISPDQLVYRLNSPQMTGRALQKSMMIAVQKEYEHNLSQQIYVSENLWKIVSLAKNEVLNIISNISIEETTTSHDFANLILRDYRTIKLDPIAQTKSALKKETELIL
jgi:hypothetical protein